MPNTESCPNCANVEAVCECVRCGSCDDRIDRCNRCHNCDCGDNDACGCCECWTCNSCDDRQSSDTSPCENCEHCSECCECQFCGYCESRVYERSFCGSCERCHDHCNCVSCGNCGDPLGNDGSDRCSMEDDPTCTSCCSCEPNHREAERARERRRTNRQSLVPNSIDADATAIPSTEVRRRTGRCSCGNSCTSDSPIHGYSCNVLHHFIVPLQPKVRYAGIELEMQLRSGSRGVYIDDAAYKMLGAIPPNTAFLKEDGSLSESPGFELVSIPMTLQRHREVWPNVEFPSCLASYKMHQCGLHVHISRPSPLTVGKVLAFLNDPENAPWLQRLGQRTFNRYCQAKKKKMTTRCNDRYEIYNLNTNHGGYQEDSKTVELRFFKGNLNPLRILRAIEFSFAVHAWADVTSIQQLTAKSFFLYVVKHRKEYPQLDEFIRNRTKFVECNEQ